LGGILDEHFEENHSPVLLVNKLSLMKAVAGLTLSLHTQSSAVQLKEQMSNVNVVYFYAGDILKLLSVVRNVDHASMTAKLVYS